MVATGASFHLTTIVAVIPLFFLLILIFGVGLILSVCNTYFTDVGYLYQVFTLILMYASSLFYPMEIVPVTVQKIFTLNPIYCAITSFRECVVYGVMPNTFTLLYLAAFAFITLGIGIILFRMFNDELILQL